MVLWEDGTLLLWYLCWTKVAGFDLWRFVGISLQAELVMLLLRASSEGITRALFSPEKKAGLRALLRGLRCLNGGDAIEERSP